MHLIFIRILVLGFPFSYFPRLILFILAFYTCTDWNPYSGTFQFQNYMNSNLMYSKTIVEREVESFSTYCNFSQWPITMATINRDLLF